MGDEQRRLVDDGQQQMRHRPGVDDPDAAIARALVEHVLDGAQSVLRLDRPPPSQPRTAGPSIRMIRRTSGSSSASRKAGAPGQPLERGFAGHRPGGLRTQVGLDIFEHGTEERFLVSEKVIQRAARPDAGRLDDLVGARREVALLADSRGAVASTRWRVAWACCWRAPAITARYRAGRWLPAARVTASCQLAYYQHLTVDCHFLSVVSTGGGADGRQQACGRVREA